MGAFGGICQFGFHLFGDTILCQAKKENLQFKGQKIQRETFTHDQRVPFSRGKCNQR
jgi:hypothetical protein